LDLLGRRAGPLFSSGDDMGSRESTADREPGPDQHPSFAVNGGRLSAESRMLQEWHYYFFFENTRRWRNLRKTDRDAKEDHGFRHGRHPEADRLKRPSGRTRRRFPAKVCKSSQRWPVSLPRNRL
jgi:hypothetical protein